ncbi:MAG: thioredoxin family protein [Proteobacteria bacterium]|nr:thioredoxin family protein [Pseudomonadota bacterium]
MSTMSIRIAAAMAAFALTTATAFAGQPFDGKAFKNSQAAGRTILVEVTAPWCPVCKQQKPTLSAIEKERPSLVTYEVDFDSAKDTLKQFKVTTQSTLIVFKGGNEVGRSTGQTDPAQIRGLIAKGF